MSGFLRFAGLILLMLFLATFIFGGDIENTFKEKYKPYGYDLINHKWLILGLSIVVIVAGNLTKVTKAVKAKRAVKITRKKRRIRKITEINNVTDTTFQNNDYKKVQTNYKAQQFINSHQGEKKALAEKVDWSPLVGNGANFKTTYLKQIKSSRIEVCRSKGGILFSGLFLIVGLVVLVIGLNTVFKASEFEWEMVFLILFGLVFTAIGLLMFYWPRPKVFDLRQGWFWSGSKSLAREQDFMKLKESARLSEIEAIQILSRRNSQHKGGSYTSWEINIVSKDGQRLNVMSHGHHESIKSDAQLLGHFLGVPVWDIT